MLQKNEASSVDPCEGQGESEEEIIMTEQCDGIGERKKYDQEHRLGMTLILIV